MRRVSILVLILILLNFTVIHADMEDKLSNHWSKDMIDKSFVAYYFPYLARQDFNRFDPNGTISQDEFNLSVTSLLKDYEVDIPWTGSMENLTRKDMVSFLGNGLMSIGIENNENVVLPFRDINTMDNNSIELLRLLYSNGIINGDNKTIFAPDRKLSQAESIVILQRMREVIENMNNIPFKTLGIVQSFNNQEELVMTQDGDRILLTVTKEFPTPGYEMKVIKITKEKDGQKIQFDIKPPSPDSMQLQVVTYKTITIVIDKKDIGNDPYNFILDGYNKILSKDTP